MTVDHSPETTTPADPETKPKREVPDGWILVPLVTELGEGEIAVPPRGKWGSMARNRITQGDDLGWAAFTLSDDDVATWRELDPTSDEVEEFFESFNRLSPDVNRARRRAQRANG